MTFSPSTDLPLDVTPQEVDFVSRVACQVESRDCSIDYVTRHKGGRLRVTICRPTGEHPKADLRIVGDGWATLDGGKETPLTPSDVARVLCGKRLWDGSSKTLTAGSPAAPTSSTATAVAAETSSEAPMATVSSLTDPATHERVSSTSDAPDSGTDLPTFGKRCSD
jgi:hypothetical protein